MGVFYIGWTLVPTNTLKAQSQHFKSIVSFEIQCAGTEPKLWKTYRCPDSYRLCRWQCGPPPKVAHISPWVHSFPSSLIFPRLRKSEGESKMALLNSLSYLCTVWKRSSSVGPIGSTVAYVVGTGLRRLHTASLTTGLRPDWSTHNTSSSLLLNHSLKTELFFFKPKLYSGLDAVQICPALLLKHKILFKLLL